MKNYRIVCDPFALYHVQFRTWYWPFWRDAYGTNSCDRLDRARELARRHSHGLARNEIERFELPVPNDPKPDIFT